jgi:hypothetical protein
MAYTIRWHALRHPKKLARAGHRLRRALRPRQTQDLEGSTVLVDSQVAIDSIADLYVDQPVLHGERRATFLHMSRGAAIIRYWGDSHAVSVPLEALSPAMSSAARSRRPLAASDEPITRDPSER